MSDFLAQFVSQGSQLLGPLWPVVWSLIKIICVVLPVMGCVAYLTLWERKMRGQKQVLMEAVRVGTAGLLQPNADAVKLLL